MDGDELANAITITDMRFGALAFILQVLRRDAYGNVRVEGVVFTDRQGPSMNTLPISFVPAPTEHPAPMTQNGPMSAVSAIVAAGSTIAVG